MTELTLMLEDDVLEKVQRWAESQNLTTQQAMIIACTEGIAVLENSVPSNVLTLEDRKAFLKLPLAERRRLLAEQAEAMLSHYEQNREWEEIAAGDLIEY